MYIAANFIIFRESSSTMAFSYIATSLRPTAVNVAICCHFSGTNDQNLIIAKGNRLELHKLTPDGLQPMLDVGIYGRIVALAPYRTALATQDSVFVLTDKKLFCALTFDLQTRKLASRATCNLRDKVGREMENGSLAITDPANRVVCVFIYEGVMKV